VDKHFILPIPIKSELNPMKIWFFSLPICLLVIACGFNPFARSAGAAISPVPTTEVAKQFQGLWARLDKGVPPANKLPISWNPSYSVLFPSEWPPTPTTTWVRYAYAQGMDMDLHDGVRVTGPWARLELHGSQSTASIVPLSGTLEAVTIQGVQPIDSATQAVLAGGDDVSAYCLRLTALPQANNPSTDDMRIYYHTWFKYNGAFVDLIRKDHEKFLAWVNE
jgi:hypothetical protein